MSREGQFPSLGRVWRQSKVFRFKDQLHRNRTSITSSERTVAGCECGDLHRPIRLLYTGNQSIDSLPIRFQGFQAVIVAGNCEPDPANFKRRR